MFFTVIIPSLPPIRARSVSFSELHCENLSGLLQVSCVSVRIFLRMWPEEFLTLELAHSQPTDISQNYHLNVSINLWHL